MKTVNGYYKTACPYIKRQPTTSNQASDRKVGDQRLDRLAVRSCEAVLATQAHGRDQTENRKQSELVNLEVFQELLDRLVYIRQHSLAVCIHSLLWMQSAPRSVPRSERQPMQQQLDYMTNTELVLGH